MQKTKKRRQGWRQEVAVRTSNQRLEILGDRCAICGFKETLVLDHVYPLRRGGINHRRNIVTLCARCNKAKSDKLDCKQMQVLAAQGHPMALKAIKHSLILEQIKDHPIWEKRPT